MKTPGRPLLHKGLLGVNFSDDHKMTIFIIHLKGNIKMNSNYLRGLSSDEYTALTKKLHMIQHGVCYICQKPIDLDIHTTNIDHIIPLANKGKDSEDNFALTHESCNKSKKDADLTVARSLAVLDDIRQEIASGKLGKSKTESVSLRHVLEYFGGSKYEMHFKVENGVFKYALPDMGKEDIVSVPIFTDGLSGEQTVFIELPIEYIFHDELINPRGINSSINKLVKEFYQKNPQLHLSLARVDGNKIKIFDGQHKAVAQLLLGQKKLLIRLFIQPDLDRLIITNTNAGSNLRQIAFDRSILRQLHDTLYEDKIRKYQKEHNLKEDDYSFSEQNLVDYFRGEASLKTLIINSIKNQITHSPQNKLRTYIDFEGRAKELPISYSAFDKAFLSTLLSSSNIMTTPINYRIDEGENPREVEQRQIIHLLNIIASEIYIDKFKPEIGVYRIEQRIIKNTASDITDDHLAAYRISKEEILRNWVGYLKELIRFLLLSKGRPLGDGCEFQIPFDEAMWINITNFVRNLIKLPLWKNREFAETIFSGKNNYDYWKKVFETGRNPDGVPVLAKPLNYIEMIQA